MPVQRSPSCMAGPQPAETGHGSVLFHWLTEHGKQQCKRDVAGQVEALLTRVCAWFPRSARAETGEEGA